MESKFKISDTNRQFLIIIYSIVVFYSLIYIEGQYAFAQYNSFIFLSLYAIIGFVLPILINIKCLKKPENKFDKNSIKFSIFFGIGISMIIESVTFYIFEDTFLTIVQSSLTSNLEFTLPINIAIVLAFCLIVVIYFTGILTTLMKEYCPLYCILACATAFSIMYNGNTFKNIVLGFIIFYSLALFSQMKIPIILLSISSLVAILFENIYSKYYAFGIMHYYNFAFIVVGFFFILKAIKVMEKIMFYYKLQTIKFVSLTQKEMKIIWFAVLLLGIFIATYNGRF
ncbi:MAG: hypothetical protein R3Y09_05845 [Clostridia bacterium]